MLLPESNDIFHQCNSEARRRRRSFRLYAFFFYFENEKNIVSKEDEKTSFSRYLTVKILW